LIRSVGSVLDAYDFTYKEEAKCEAKARNNVKIYEIEENAIQELINSNFEFKKLWFKYMFTYCYRLHEGIDDIYGNVDEREIRRVVENADVVTLGNNQTFDVAHGAFVFLGQIECDSLTLVKGNFVTKPSTVKSLTGNTTLLNFAPRRPEMSQIRRDRESM
jgi:hypothetical protein